MVRLRTRITNIFIRVAEFLIENGSDVYGMKDNLIVSDYEDLARKTKMIK